MSASAGINAAIVGPAAVSFYNDSLYIRAHNASTNTTTYFKKSNLVFQGDGTTSFWLQSDHLKTHYLYSDVARPSSASVKSLLEIFQTWLEESDADREAGPFISDRTSTVLNVSMLYANDTVNVWQTTLGSAVSTYDSARNGRIMTITTEQTSRIIRDTAKTTSVVNSKKLFALVSAVLINSTAVRNVISRAGCFDDATSGTSGMVPVGNGVFVQWTSAAGLAMVFRSNFTGSQVDVVVAQANWNLDTLDGAGASGLTLDPTAENTYIFEWSALRGDIVRCGYMRDGQPIWCHKFTNLRMGSACVPLRWDIGRLDTTAPVESNDAANMFQGSGSIMVQGNYDLPATVRGYSCPKVVSLATDDGPKLVCSFGMNTSNRVTKFKPFRLHLTNFDEGVAKWFIIAGSPVSSSAFTWTSIPNSRMLFDDSSAFISWAGSVVVASGFMTEPTSSFYIGEDAVRASIGDGYRGNFQLIMQYLRGVVTVSAAFEWIEVDC